MAVSAFIGLGSNLAEPERQIRAALEELAALPQTHLVAHSPLYRSRPMGPADQPDYINAVAELATELAPEPLLDELQRLERLHRRVRGVRWGPRTLDLDLLLYGAQQIDSVRLAVPHPGLPQRNFVLYPLADIKPTLMLPDGTPLARLLAVCPADGLERLGQT